MKININVLTLAFSIISIVWSSLYGEDTTLSRKFVYTIQGNIYHGSIVGRNRIDGLTGATKTVPGLSVGLEYNLKGHPLQAEITLGWTKQSITYGPPAQTVSGKRDIKLYLLDIPLMYNFHLFKKVHLYNELPRLILSAGSFISIVLYKEVIDSVIKTADISPWAVGPFLRAAYYPMFFKHIQPGIFIEFYRSFVPKVYDDAFFNENGIAGQLGIMNFGITSRF